MRTCPRRRASRGCPFRLRGNASRSGPRWGQSAHARRESIPGRPASAARPSREIPFSRDRFFSPRRSGPRLASRLGSTVERTRFRSKAESRHRTGKFSTAVHSPFCRLPLSKFRHGATRSYYLCFSCDCAVFREPEAATLRIPARRLSHPRPPLRLHVRLFFLTSLGNRRIYGATIHGTNTVRPRMEERQRGTADPFAGGRARAPRLRNQQADRAKVRGSRPVSRCLSLSAALSTRETRLARGPLGGKERSTPPPLLPAHS